MKIIAFILSVYILGLTVLPCSDNETNPNDVETIVSIQADAIDHSNDNNLEDLCPPFCSCHCCHVHTIDFGISNYTPFIVDNYLKIFSHFDSPGKDFTNSLLQPPQA